MMKCSTISTLIFLSLTSVRGNPIQNDLFKLNIIHLNDFHARFEESSRQSGTCKSEMTDCIGGISRVYTAVNNLLTQDPNNSIFLNVGDNFQGTLWYNVHRWNVTQYFLNLLPPTDAYTLGNHEFDHKIEGLVPFMRSLKGPILVANIDDSEEPDIQNLYKKSTVIIRNGKKIGIVGVIYRKTNEIANTEKLKFTDESEAVKKEAERLKKEENCDIIIVLSHAGLEIDREIAVKGGPYINVIVGGHSHSFLYNETKSPLPGPEKPIDTYPIPVTQDSGHQVLIVQASCYTKYLGSISVWFNNDGEVVSWDGNPIYLDGNITKDSRIEELLVPWKEAVDSFGSAIIGSTNVLLDDQSCRYGECNFGNFIADAFVFAWFNDSSSEEWAHAPIAILNVGGIRGGLPVGNISYADLLMAQPFENTVDVIELKGKYLKEIFEYSVSTSWGEYSFAPMNMLQVSGVKVTINPAKESGNRIEEIKLRCGKCDIPTYEPLKEEEVYRIATASFLAQGGDGFSMFPKYGQNRRIGPVDIDVLQEYMKRENPIIHGLEERITVVSN